jgi:hypothetical protein
MTSVTNRRRDLPRPGNCLESSDGSNRTIIAIKGGSSAPSSLSGIDSCGPPAHAEFQQCVTACEGAARTSKIRADPARGVLRKSLIVVSMIFSPVSAPMSSGRPGRGASSNVPRDTQRFELCEERMRRPLRAALFDDFQHPIKFVV